MTKNASVQNNFTGGLKTEFTGLNFPENACTACSNCVFSIIGDVLRREGINFEANNVLNNINTSGQAISYFRWLNAGGDGQSQIFVLQVGNTLYFFLTSSSTSASPASAQLLGSTVTINTFQATNNVATVSAIECQYASGNGYLFVYHPDCDPFYCTYSSGTVSAAIITMSIRDFAGILEPSVAVNLRPGTLTAEHQYNLQNQGWTAGSAWSIQPTAPFPDTGTAWPITVTYNVPSGVSGPAPGQTVSVTWARKTSSGGGTFGGSGTIISYVGSAMVINLFSGAGTNGSVVDDRTIFIQPSNTGYINTWHSDEGNYPSNADQWWSFKDTTNTFNPSTTAAQVTLNSGQAPQGYYLLNPFIQQRSSVSSISGLTDVTTSVRPRTGTWFQGRVWYAGVDASQAATGDAQFYTWTENIYFSTIVTSIADFGTCYQTNDPTSENLFDVLPSDGGVIVIQGSGAIYKLFPVQNGILVFASNGVWFITGSQGIGFTATDYTVTKISSVKCISSTSFIDVLGYPVFWNQEGIYRVSPGQQGFNVEPLTLKTILSFYNTIPLDSKRYARGDYNPITYVISWVYRSTEEAGLSNRYQFDSSLNLNTVNSAFYPYSFGNNGSCFVNGLVYIDYPSGSLTPQFKYLTSVNTQFTFSEENDGTNWLDFFSFDSTGVNYTSTFTAGYSLGGKGIMKWQPTYLYMYARNAGTNEYLIQSIWDYAGDANTGRWSNQQYVTAWSPHYNMLYRRHRLGGHGQAFQLNITSVQGKPFDIMGWTVLQNIDAGV